MSNRYLNHATSPATQREILPGQLTNNAGGGSFAVDDWVRLDRFLILGSEGGSYYTTERKLTRDNAGVVDRLVKSDGVRLVNRVVEISVSGRAPKNDAAILALALAARGGDTDTRQAAYAALPAVCRIGTHLYHFVEHCNALGGWGRGLRRAVGNWFNNKNANDLALQLVKYQARDGWSSRDCLRLSHPIPESPAHACLYGWATNGFDAIAAKDPKVVERQLPAIIHAFEEAKKLITPSDIPRLCRLITEHKLPRECIPTQMLEHAFVWEALLPHMGLTAVIRNLGNMTKCGLISPLSRGASAVIAKLGDAENIHRSRVHPLALLQAQVTYASGHGVKGHSSWNPVQPIIDALDAGFYTAFKNVRSTGKSTLLAIDVSGSMNQGTCSGMTGISPRVGAAAMALVTANAEPNAYILGFTAAGGGFYGGKWGGGSSQLTNLAISPHMRLTDVVRIMDAAPLGGTDCALPFIWAKDALKNGAKVENFALYTDNETWAGHVHPHVALADYRRASGVDAKSVVVGMLANEFTIADPNDPGMMDVVGFDSAAPAIMSDFFGAGSSGADPE